MPQIVTINVSQQVAPTPSVLQQTGAFISQGGTSLTAGTYALLTSASSLATYIVSAASIATMSWASELVTVATTNPHGFRTGDTLLLDISGVVPSSYNGTFLVTITGASGFTYQLISSPGSVTIQGVYIPTSATQLSQMNNTFWAQGSIVPVYVLELGAGNVSDGVTALEAFIAVNSSPQFFYSYLVPRYWDGNSAFLAMLANFEALDAKTYFFITTTLGTYKNYTTEMKDVLALIETPALGTWPSNVVTELLAAPAEPTLSSSSGGTLPATTYYARVTYMTAYGETPASPEANEAVLVDNVLVVDSPSAMTGATGWNVYVGTTAGSETLQNSTPIAIATNWTEPDSGLINGVAYPATGFAVATTTTAHGIAVGQWFNLTGFTPTGYNNWYEALGGTNAETLVFYVLQDLAPESVLGSLAASFANQTGLPTGAAGEFTLASVFYKTLGYNPSSTNMMTALQFSFLYGVTSWATQGTSNIMAALKAANINIAIPASQGGIAETMLVWGMTADGNQYTWWYSADWAQINYALSAANTIINGSNNPTNPLYLNQNGINTVQDTLMQTSTTAVQVGLANGTPARSTLTGTALAAALDAGTYDGDILVNAVPFAPYYQQNPGQYKQGIYNGYSIQYIPQLGFEQITINLVLTDFPAGA